MAAGITCAGVRRTFGDVVAIEEIDLVAASGQVTALVGPNGAGKTTLLLILATLLKPDRGEIRVAGNDPVAEPAKVRAQLGWMPDSFGLYETLTARELLEFAAAAYRIPRAHARARAVELLQLAHLAEFADRPVHVLSRGQKQRLGLARALIHDPEVLLLDEPAAGLDPRSRIELRALLRALAAQGRTLLVSSHVLSELEEIADCVVLVDRGRTVAVDSIAALSGSRPWRLRALDRTALVTALQKLGREPRVGDAGVEVLLTGDEDAADLVAALIGEGVRLAACAPASSALETAYLAMTEDRR